MSLCFKARNLLFITPNPAHGVPVIADLANNKFSKHKWQQIHYLEVDYDGIHIKITLIMVEMKIKELLLKATRCVTFLGAKLLNILSSLN